MLAVRERQHGFRLHVSAKVQMGCFILGCFGGLQLTNIAITALAQGEDLQGSLKRLLMLLQMLWARFQSEVHNTHVSLQIFPR